MINQIKNPTFGGFKPDAMQRIAGTLGYTGDMSGFQQYLEQNPDKRTQMDQFKQAAMMMAKGGAVRKYQEGGTAKRQGYAPGGLTGAPPPTTFENDYSNPATLAQYEANIAPGGIHYTSSSDQAATKCS